ncbi:hypothetical protein MVEN_00078000 [Mycena venus]|uniref:Uncharacterized protein n=1 Tax=Mycena venus TaxID=2733690 RepID=A0A8H6Z4I5_9AGAR|nr:hypothetical protein MVEN_00078000 [Mycena venus]
MRRIPQATVFLFLFGTTRGVDPLQITPNGVCADGLCEVAVGCPLTVDWSGGTPPYSLVYVPSSMICFGPAGHVLLVARRVALRRHNLSVVLILPIRVDSTFTLELSDSTGTMADTPPILLGVRPEGASCQIGTSQSATSVTSPTSVSASGTGHSASGSSTKPPSPSGKHTSKTSPIAGAVVGVLLFITLLFAVWWYFRVKRRRQRIDGDEDKAHSEAPTVTLGILEQCAAQSGLGLSQIQPHADAISGTGSRKDPIILRWDSQGTSAAGGDVAEEPATGGGRERELERRVRLLEAHITSIEHSPPAYEVSDEARMFHD